MIGKTISHYKILEKLGEGGMGVVYKAEDTKLERPVALKFLSPSSLGTEEEKIRFIREAKAAAALDHPNICTVHEIDEAEGRTFIAMAYVDGQSLEEKVESGPLEIKKALDITVQVAEGLKEAHKKGIIHRDIKSANIMVTEDGKAKIMDFGLAKLAGRTRLTKTATIMGTVAYMSPEQASGEAAIDHRTDIWSLGVVLYKMLAGKPPFDASSDPALIYKIVHEAPERISNLRSDISPALERAIEKMLHKSPQDRHEDVQAVIIDLKSAKPRGVIVEEKSSPSIAVLPFVDMSPEKDQEYFCDGLAEELINALTQIKDLHVVARTSAFSFKGEKLDVRDIGRKLSVQTVLEGSVRKAGNRLRITGQLVKVADGYHLWSEKYDRQMDDIFAIQDEISDAIVDKLKPALLGAERKRIVERQTVDIEAYNLYLRGRYFASKLTEPGLKRAIEYFEQAIELQTDYAAAYAGLADAYASFPFHAPLPSKDILLKAKEAAHRALELDDTLGEAHTSLAFVKAMYDWDWGDAEKEFKRAIELNPGYALAHHWYALCLMLLARFDEAIREIKIAYDLDPFHLVVNRELGLMLHYAGQYDQAADALQKAIEMDPSFPLVHLYLGIVYLNKSMHEEAMAECEKEKLVSGGWSPAADAAIAGIHAIAGRIDEANKRFHDLLERSKQDYVSPTFLASACFAFGETDRGFELLDKAYQERDHWLCILKIYPWFAIIHSDPRYIAMLKKIGLDK